MNTRKSMAKLRREIAEIIPSYKHMDWQKETLRPLLREGESKEDWWAFTSWLESLYPKLNVPEGYGEEVKELLLTFETV